MLGLVFWLAGCVSPAADVAGETAAAEEDCDCSQASQPVARVGIALLSSHADWHEVPIDSLLDRHQTLDDAKVQRLKTQIAQAGFRLDDFEGVPRILELPVTLRGNKRFLIRNGHHRIQAMRELCEATVPAEIFSPADPDYVPSLTYLTGQGLDEGALTREEHDAILGALP